MNVMRSTNGEVTRSRMLRKALVVLTLIFVFGSSLLSQSFVVSSSDSESVARAATASAPNLTGCQNFSETGHQVCGRFLEYWQANGGLAQQGLPVSDMFEEKNADPPAGDGKTHRVQYFQRARFEEHLENQPPYDVLLGLLGSEQGQAKYQSQFPPQKILPAQPCQHFNETGLDVCGRFLEYWKANGGLAQQGLPISGIFEELNAPPPAGDGKLHLVQYFQRARFEQHGENQPPYDVLLGLLGTEQYKAKYGTGGGLPPAPTPTPAPTTPPSGATPTPTPTPAPTTPAPSGGGVPTSGCLPALSGNVTQVQACVSNPSPTQRSNETVYGRLVVNGVVQSGVALHSTWHYKSKDSYCDTTVGSDGVAACTLNISTATHGFTVTIDVQMGDYSGSTSFTTQ